MEMGIKLAVQADGSGSSLPRSQALSRVLCRGRDLSVAPVGEPRTIGALESDWSLLFHICWAVRGEPEKLAHLIS